MILSPQFLEAVNGTLGMIFVAILIVFGRYVLLELWRCGFREGRRKRAAAIAVMTLIAGDLVIRGFIWSLRHAENQGIDVADWRALVTLGTTIGGGICLFGGVCILRHFSPDAWRCRIVILAPIGALTFGVGMAWLPSPLWALAPTAALAFSILRPAIATVTTWLIACVLLFVIGG